MSDAPKIKPGDVAEFAERFLHAPMRKDPLRFLSDKELRRQYHALRTQYADVKREIERRKTVKKHAREQATRMRAPG